VGMGGRITRAQFKELMAQMQTRSDEILQVLKRLPKEILFMLRSTVLVRALNMELGSPVNRFTVFGRQAARALRQHQTSDGDGFVSRWSSWLGFEWTMGLEDAKYWLGSVWLKVLKLLGRVPEELTMDGVQGLEGSSNGKPQDISVVIP